MFRRLINDAKTAASAVVLRYVARASVAVPFVIAAGFATAAITIMLVERYGSLAAYWMLAGGFCVIGMIAALVVTVKEQEEEVAEAKAEQSDTPSVAQEVAMQAPLALLSAVMASPFGPTSALSMVKVLGRNIPLVVLLAISAFLMWPRDEQAAATSAADNPQEPPAPDNEQLARKFARSKPNGVYTGDDARL